MSIVVNTNTNIKTQTIVNPHIIPYTSLIYYVDAANPISYPVSSSTWFDLSSTQNTSSFIGSTWQLLPEGDGEFYYGWGGVSVVPQTSSEYGGGIIYDGYTDNYPTSSIVTQYSAIGRVAELQPENVTVNIWFKVSGSYFGSPPRPLNVIFRSRLGGYIILQRPNQTLEVSIFNTTSSLPVDSSTPAFTANSYSSSFNFNQVYNYTFSLGNNKFKTYINGTLVSEQPTFANFIIYNKDTLNGPALGNNYVAIGCDGDNPDRFFQGTIYNVELFNRALSDTEVSNLFNYFNIARSFNV
jgi:hypothetical protein